MGLTERWLHASKLERTWRDRHESCSLRDAHACINHKVPDEASAAEASRGWPPQVVAHHCVAVWTVAPASVAGLLDRSRPRVARLRCTAHGHTPTVCDAASPTRCGAHATLRGQLSAGSMAKSTLVFVMTWMGRPVCVCAASQLRREEQKH